MSEDEDPPEGVVEDTETIDRSFYEADLRWCQIPYGLFWHAQRIERVVASKVRRRLRDYLLNC